MIVLEANPERRIVITLDDESEIEITIVELEGKSSDECRRGRIDSSKAYG